MFEKKLNAAKQSLLAALGQHAWGPGETYFENNFLSGPQPSLA